MERRTFANGFFVQHAELGEIRFWTKPKVFRIGRTTVDHAQLHSYFDVMGFQPSDTQLMGTDPEILIESGARDCYFSYGGKSRGSREHFAHLREVNHGSVYRHANFTFKIVGVSRGFTHEMVRHAAGCAYSQTSSRYIHAKALGFVVPPDYRGTPIESEFVTKCIADLELYDRHLKLLEKEYLLRMPGQDAITLRKRARGAARAVLPIGLAQVLQVTMNAQAIRHVLRMRGSIYAETEIREVAVELAKWARKDMSKACEDVDIEVNGDEVNVKDPL
jgi:thymidylate synthase (FAD)